MNHLWKDLVFAARMLRTKPTFTLTAILSLALGIGACTAIFSIVDAVLLRALPYPDAERIMQIREVNEKGVRIAVAEPNYVDLKTRNQSLDVVAQFAGGGVVVTGGNEPVRSRAFWVSSDFFSVFGVKPAMGRGFLPEESKPGAGAFVAVVSHGFWQRVLGGKPDFNGTKINVDGPAFTVVGVMPPGFSYPKDADIWVPREVEPPHTSRTAHNWSVVARVRSTVTIEQARADLNTIGSQLRQEHGKGVDLTTFALIPLQEYLTENVRSGLLLLLAAVGLLLLVACANVANMILADATTRTSEFAVRAAMGATPWRMMRQFITENLLLTVLAGALGILLSFWGLDVLLSLNADNLPRVDEIAVNRRALGFTLGLAFVIAIVLGIAPVARFAFTDLHTSLKEAGRSVASGGFSQRLRHLLVVTQIALTLVLLIGAGLIGRTFLKLMQTDPGFKPESVVVMTLTSPTTLTKEQEQWLQQKNVELLERVTQMPGAIAAGSINALPLTGRGGNGTFLIDNNQATKGQAEYRLASSGYFSAMGIPLLQGRFFEPGDTNGAPDAAIISQSVAQKYWPNENPIGRTIQFGNMDGDQDLLHIVGIVGDVRDDGLDQPSQPTVYAHAIQRPQWWQVSNQSYVVRAQTDPQALIAALRTTAQSLNPDAVLRFQTLEAVVSESLNARRFSLVLFGVFAGVALLLAASGVYGVMSYSVTQRTHEIGVRVALGAQRLDILRLVIWQGMMWAMLGVAVGIGGAFAVTRLMATMVYAVTPTDPWTFAGAAILLTVVALLACYLPARRATKVDPMIALRCE